jgi:hypothetical protein
MSAHRTFLTTCASCGGCTSKSYARTHDNKCKHCATGQGAPSKHYRRGGRYFSPCDYSDDREDHRSYREIEMCDRLDYAREVAEAGDPERAAEIRMGA